MHHPPSGLLSLATEILLNVIQYIPTNDLLSLCWLCRRLHYIVLPNYYLRLGLPDMTGPADSLTLQDEQLNALEPLGRTLFLTSVKSFSCSFRMSSKHFLQDVGSVIRILHRLSSVEEAYIDFGNTGTSSGDKLEKSDNEAWREACCCLYNVVVSKCSRVYLRGAVFRSWKKEDDLKDVSRWNRILHAISPRKASRTASSGSDEGSKPTTWMVPHRTAVEKLSLDNSMLFYVPMFHWTLLTINDSRLTDLSLLYTAGSIAQWASFLKQLTIPLLQRLTFDSCVVEFADLLDFLHRHPQIEYLYIGGPLLPEPILKNNDLHLLSRAQLTNLKCLKAPPQYLISFLSKTNSGALEKLEEITIISSASRPQLATFIGINWPNLYPIMARLKSPDITLHLEVQLANLRWTHPPSAPSCYQGFLTFSPHISGIEVDATWLHWSDGKEFERDQWLIVRFWLEEMEFPNLKYLALYKLFTLTRWKKFRNRPMATMVKKSFVRCVAESVPSVEVVRIDDEERSIEGWDSLVV